jgi:hypothetical protein
MTFQAGIKLKDAEPTELARGGSTEAARLNP